MKNKVAVKTVRTGVIIDIDSTGSGLIQDNLFGFLYMFTRCPFPVRRGMNIVFTPRILKNGWKKALDVLPATLAFLILQDMQRISRIDQIEESESETIKLMG